MSDALGGETPRPTGPGRDQLVPQAPQEESRVEAEQIGVESGTTKGSRVVAPRARQHGKARPHVVSDDGVSAGAPLPGDDPDSLADSAVAAVKSNDRKSGYLGKAGRDDEI